MATKENRAQVVSKVIERVGFSFYNTAEARAISVKQITSPILLDNMENPVPGGLYDPALGPLDQTGRCPTCGEPTLLCPGHFGHIDLALPVYNPLVFSPLVKILKHVCLFCHCFKMDRKRVQRYADQLELLHNGHEAESAKTNLNMGEESSDLESSTEGAYQTKVKTSGVLNAIKDLLKRFMEDIPKSKCENCEANVPTLRSEGVGKIFQMPLQKSKLSSNIMSGHRLEMASIINDALLDEGNLDEEGRSVGLASDQNANSVLTTVKGLETTADLSSQLRYLTTFEVKVHINRLWSKEKRICSLIWDAQKAYNEGSNEAFLGSSDFFLEAVLVPPNRFRPPNRLQGVMMEHPMNVLYADLLQANMNLMNVLRDGSIKYKPEDFAAINSAQVTALWLSLQNCTNKLIDSSTAIGKKGEQNGVRQLLEKKDGLFRMNLMGKRVNYSCRSVISPDPYIAVNEIGIPPYFATRLTYPEKVTHWNVNRLREAVTNGASVYPGATHVEDELGVVVSLNNVPRPQRLALSKTLLSTPSSTTGSTGGGNPDSVKVGGKIVYRHLRDGDALLVNRQPTLHKPSLMGHIARVLKGEKTLRLHYANCSTYNADFDGDEMNVHFPQDEAGRAEAYQIVNANQQFVVPTSGNPIRGLIQDHIVSGTLLTKRDTFLTREEYQELVYSACISSIPATYLKGPGRRKVGVIARDRSIKPLAPAILKPKQLWTGKQVVSTILGYVTSGRLPYTIKNTGKVSGEYLGRNSGETKLRIKENELLHGVIDKAQFGKYGLVHAFKEFYGADAAGQLLSSFSRLFTSFLQMYGFTCGISDLLLVPEGEQHRQMKLAAAQELGLRVHKRFVGLDDDENSSANELKLEIENSLQSKGASASALLDRLMSSSMNVVTSEVNNALFPRGLYKPFPHNCLSLMTTTGAKGGLVNFTQISSLLGQQELEGRRVPRMSSGKTLPCFPPWDTAARAGGFISDRFLSGLRLQEYYFHCMAGRDGLVDTAVKTSRSGYLQRCLIKNLECLRVHYDYSVRDSDGSIIQFRYGEDGVDVMKTNYLTQFKTLAANRTLLSQRIGVDATDEETLQNDTDATFEKISESFHQQLKQFLRTIPKSKKEALHLAKHKERRKFKNLMNLNFISSCAEPGEPVGVLAAQSIGEPSTQMTLNTFHLAGRGEMNVTLGIPRLREIFMTAAKKISTPVMTCPLLPGKSREDAERLAAKLRRVRLVDVIEKLEVGVIPFSMQDGRMRKVYNIKLTFLSKERYPPYLQLQMHEYELALRHQFSPIITREMGKAVSFRSGEKAKDAIRVLSLSQLGEWEEDKGLDDEEDHKVTKSARNTEHGEQIEEDDGDLAAEEDGADAEKRRAQETDERAYDEEADEEESTDGVDVENAQSEDEVENEAEKEDNKNKHATLEDELEKNISAETGKKKQAKVRSTFDGACFEMRVSVKHDTPHILLSETVERVAKQVSLRSMEGIDRVSVIDYNGDVGTPALQTEGINFEGLWSMSDDLDVNRLTTNSIAAVLEIYGVEAARATIVSEVKKVFMSYGISVDIRHLNLIADFMTHSGGFRPCNRIGIHDKSSPFLKMSFETASKFLVESTLKRQWDHLDSPSSRIILGQVVDMGTGSFDLLQNIHA
ncbi:hypothetical protein GOP47_0019410 [Adiantum capillus-veneris]|uniref:DNA-directed RNA polymerase subunit n=1 Tax=Adiantum capillus-veneris TaxID=13818 RepID=A0A9D4UB94_ADICA|nr:hypothetical protein GOP47_0019410 [Adiantum capillus-veneris]